MDGTAKEPEKAKTDHGMTIRGVVAGHEAVQQARDET